MTVYPEITSFSCHFLSTYLSYYVARLGLFHLLRSLMVFQYCRTVFLNRRATARYQALASIIPGRERPEETTICYKISLVQRLITNLNVILHFSTCHTIYISVLILFMIMP